MKVADSMIGMEQGRDGPMDKRASSVSHRAHEGEIRHDARGLVIAVMMSLVCWGALGVFLLS